MNSSNNDLKYVNVNKDNFLIAYHIQKEIWPNEVDYHNFYEKANESSPDVASFIIYYQDTPIGITGTYIEDFDDESIWLDWFGILPSYRRRGFGKTVLLDTIRYCQSLDKYLYFRLDTNYWENRPAIYLYDSVMDLREDYTVEDTKTEKHQYLIYTYNLKRTKDTKPWDNRYIGLVEHYHDL